MNEYISDEDMFAFICEYDEPAAIRTDVIDEEEEEEEEDVDLTLLFDVRAEDDDEFWGGGLKLCHVMLCYDSYLKFDCVLLLHHCVGGGVSM